MPETAEVELAPVEIAPVNIAAIMAKQGVMVDPGSDIEIPDINTETKTEAQPPAQQGETPAKPEAKVEVKVQESTPAPEAKPTEAPPKQETQPPAPQDWKEVLKQQPDKKEVLKALGLDDKLVGFIDHYTNGGNVKEYLENLTVDYKAMPAEEVMRRHLRAENPELGQEDFEEYCRMEITEKYKQDPDMFSEQEVKRGKILLSTAAKTPRAQLEASQQKYLFDAPKANADPRLTEYQQKEQQQRENLSSYKNIVAENPSTKAFVANSKITVGEGENAFDYNVQSPQDVVDLLYDGPKWASKMTNPDGTPNIAKQLLIAAIVNDDSSFLTAYASHVKKQAISSITPADDSTHNPAKSGGGPKDPAAEMAKSGRIVSG